MRLLSFQNKPNNAFLKLRVDRTFGNRGEDRIKGRRNGNGNVWRAHNALGGMAG